VIQVANGVEDYQVTGGPGWIDSDRYDIKAKAENAGAGKPEMTVMLQSLLADRFKLKVRREMRDFQGPSRISEGPAFAGPYMAGTLRDRA
jgi:uncharacterized protein (TIGR03435 family)